MLLGSVDLDRNGARIVLAQQILNRVDVMLPHVSQSARIANPSIRGTSRELDADCRVVGSRTEPHVVVELGGDLHLFELGLPHPEELPVETGMLADSHLQRPTEHAAVDELLDLVDVVFMP